MSRNRPAIRVLALSLLLLPLLLAGSAGPATAQLVNGSFEDNDGARNFDGWETFDLDGDDLGGDWDADWFVHTGTTSPLTGNPVPAPVDGIYSALSDQLGAGLHVLYQDVVVPEGGVLSCAISADNWIEGNDSWTGPDDWLVPETLFAEHTMLARGDVVDPATPVDSVDADFGVLENFFSTEPGDPLHQPFTLYEVDLSAYAGEEVRIRFLEADTVWFLNMGVDACVLSSRGLVGDDEREVSSDGRDSVSAINSRGDRLVVWRRLDDAAEGLVGKASSGGVFGQLFDKNDNPTGSEFEVATGDVQGSPSVTATGDDFFVGWPETGSLKGKFFDETGTSQGPAIEIESGGGLGEPQVAASREGFAMVWQKGGMLEATDGIFGKFFDKSGEPAGEAKRLDPGTGLDPQKPSAGADGEGDVFVVWQESPGALEASGGIFARFFDKEGNAKGGGAQLDDGEATEPAASVNAGGQSVAAWQKGSATEANGSGVFAQLLNPNGTKKGPVVQVNQQTGGSQGNPAVAMGPQGGFAAVWEATSATEASSGIFGQLFDKDGNAKSSQDFPVATTSGDATPKDPSVTITEDGDLKVTFHKEGADGSDQGLFTRTFHPVDDTGEGCPGEPAGSYFTIPELPDIGFKVAITAQDGSVVSTQQDPVCISETVCVSGAIPGRSEVFLRVVGPKPNGKLWPTLVKFSTSEVEIWIKQLSTGACQNYVLAGASPGNDVLPGLFDRDGFDPSGGAAPAVMGVKMARLVERAAVENGPAPPAGPWATTGAVPGFRFKARITAQDDSVIEPQQESDCIDETLCFSGAVPGRSEIFARVVGPKPNGNLWPTLVKFSTSEVEIWIEQASTGQVNYYLLEGASPGSDDLTGLFDRNGFEP